VETATIQGRRPKPCIPLFPGGREGGVGQKSKISSAMKGGRRRKKKTQTKKQTTLRRQKKRKGIGVPGWNRK